MKKIVSLYALAVLAMGCSSPAEPGATGSPEPAVSMTAAPAPEVSPTAAPPVTSEPKKEDALAVLTRVADALKDGKGSSVASDFKIPEGAPPEVVDKELAKLYERKEISPEGVKLLAKNGEWGKLKELFPEQAERWSSKMNAPVDQCYGFKLESKGTTAEVGFVWDGSKLQIIRLDDVGKLE